MSTNLILSNVSAASKGRTLLPLKKFSEFILNLSPQGVVNILDHGSSISPAEAQPDHVKSTKIGYYYLVDFEGGDEVVCDEYENVSELIAALARVDGIKEFQPGCLRVLLEASSHEFEGAEVAEVVCNVEWRFERPMEKLLKGFFAAMAVAEPLSHKDLTSGTGRLPGLYEFIVLPRANGTIATFLPGRTFDRCVRDAESERLQTELQRLDILGDYHESRWSDPRSCWG